MQVSSCPALQSASSAVLHRYSFGFKPDVHTPVAYMDESHCIYVSGHTIIRLDADTKRQRALECTPSALGVSALAVAPDKRWVEFRDLSSKRPKSARGVPSPLHLLRPLPQTLCVCRVL